MDLHRYTAWRRTLVMAATVLVAISGAGCSTKAWYGGVRMAAENDCRRQPPSDTQACLARVNTLPYEEYERKRTGQSP
jgi:hypothetical protein